MDAAARSFFASSLSRVKYTQAPATTASASTPSPTGRAHDGISNDRAVCTRPVGRDGDCAVARGAGRAAGRCGAAALWAAASPCHSVTSISWPSVVQRALSGRFTMLSAVIRPRSNQERRSSRPSGPISLPSPRRTIKPCAMSVSSSGVGIGAPLAPTRMRRVHDVRAFRERPQYSRRSVDPQRGPQRHARGHGAVRGLRGLEPPERERLQHARAVRVRELGGDVGWCSRPSGPTTPANSTSLSSRRFLSPSASSAGTETRGFDQVFTFRPRLRSSAVVPGRSSIAGTPGASTGLRSKATPRAARNRSTVTSRPASAASTPSAPSPTIRPLTVTA